MWLYCRELVCSYLLDADDVVGQLAGSNLSVVHLTGTAKENIEYGVTESEMFNDSSMQILFEMKQVKHGLKNGEDTDKILTLLEVIKFIFFKLNSKNVIVIAFLRVIQQGPSLWSCRLLTLKKSPEKFSILL